MENIFLIDLTWQNMNHFITSSLTSCSLAVKCYIYGMFIYYKFECDEFCIELSQKCFLDHEDKY